MVVSNRRGVESVEGDEHLAGKQNTLVSIELQAVSDDRRRLYVVWKNVGSIASFTSHVQAAIQKLKKV